MASKHIKRCSASLVNRESKSDHSEIPLYTHWNTAAVEYSLAVPQRVKHKMYHFKVYRRQWHPTPVLLPGKSHGRRSLEGCNPWGHYESDTTERLLSLFTFMHWRRKWQPTPVFSPGESQGWRSLMGCCLWGCTELDTTEVTWQQAAASLVSNGPCLVPFLNFGIFIFSTF